VLPAAAGRDPGEDGSHHPPGSPTASRRDESPEKTRDSIVRVVWQVAVPRGGELHLRPCGRRRPRRARGWSATLGRSLAGVSPAELLKSLRSSGGMGRIRSRGGHVVLRSLLGGLASLRSGQRVALHARSGLDREPRRSGRCRVMPGNSARADELGRPGIAISTIRRRVAFRSLSRIRNRLGPALAEATRRISIASRVPLGGSLMVGSQRARLRRIGVEPCLGRRLSGCSGRSCSRFEIATACAPPRTPRNARAGSGSRRARGEGAEGSPPRGGDAARRSARRPGEDRLSWPRAPPRPQAEIPSPGSR